MAVDFDHKLKLIENSVSCEEEESYDEGEADKDADEDADSEKKT